MSVRPHKNFRIRLIRSHHCPWFLGYTILGWQSKRTCKRRHIHRFRTFRHRGIRKLNNIGPVEPPNRVFDLVRQAFVDLRLDADHHGSPAWNPLGTFIQPGQTVLLKPNWVRHSNPIDPSIDSLVTHSAVIRAVLEYVLIALQERGSVVLADAPLQSCDFEQLVTRNRARELLEVLSQEHPQIAFRLIDLRRTVFKERTLKESLRGDVFQTSGAGADDGYTLVKLDEQSLLTDLDDRFERFRVTQYDPTLMLQHHNREVNEYLIGNPLLQADVIVNLPKMKTHVKAGITGALKNLIGINGHKGVLTAPRRPVVLGGWRPVYFSQSL